MVDYPRISTTEFLLRGFGWVSDSVISKVWFVLPKRYP